MIEKRGRFQILLILALGLPIAAFATFAAWLVVPEVLRVVVPSVVQTVASR
jgi:hypothetical protein